MNRNMLFKTHLQIFFFVLLLGLFIYAILFISNGTDSRIGFRSPFYLVKSSEEINSDGKIEQSNKYKIFEYRTSVHKFKLESKSFKKTTDQVESVEIMKTSKKVEFAGKLESTNTLKSSSQVKSSENIDSPNKIYYFDSQCECKRNEQIILKKYNSHFTVNSYNRTQNSTKFLYKIDNDDFKYLNLTCNIYNSLRRGRDQKVLAFALYGNNTFFYDKLKVITKQIDLIYAGWKMRVYHDNSIKKSIICEIECAKGNTKNNSRLLDNADFCNIENDTHLNPINLDALNETFTNFSYIHAMKWRWMPIGDSFVEAFSSRDTDSYLLQREVDSVNVWTKSNKLGHIMRGGMWGFYNSRDRQMANKLFELIVDKNTSLIDNGKHQNVYNADQVFLAKVVYPLIVNNSVVHDSYLCKVIGGEPFPTKREGNCQIGSKWGCVLNKKHYICPEECRPEYGKDWDTC